MKGCVLLSLLLALGCVRGAPVDQEGLEPGSCDDAQANGAAGLAIEKINQDRTDGYIYALQRLSNVHMKPHGENGMVFYLTLDVAETNCSVLSRKDWKECEVRSDASSPVYGQCRVAIFISKVNRVVRLYKYQCLVRPVPGARVNAICPDCPTGADVKGEQIQKVVTQSLDKFNKESSFANRFVLLKVLGGSMGMALSMYYNAEYTIQEATCPKSTEAVTDTTCPPMSCEFAHKGFCKGSMWETPDGVSEVSVECEIYEPEAADREKKAHLLGGETDHSHNDTHPHSATHDAAHAADHEHGHDHAHDHTKPHADHVKAHVHAEGDDHHHTHDHEHQHGQGQGAHRHSHPHSHDHGHGHDHVHAHHAKAHDHSGDQPGHHHDYKHGDGTEHTHQHDHELALDHDHKHAHLHEHEHHHHHEKHEHEDTPHDHPDGQVKEIGHMDEPLTMPIFDDKPPEAGVVLMAKADPQIPGEMEPVILWSLPAANSAQCPVPPPGKSLLEQLLVEDSLFKGAAWA